MSSRTPKKIPISRCIKRSWEFQDFKVTGHPFWELWNEILHSTQQIDTSNSLGEVKSVKLVNYPKNSKETNTNADR